MIGLAIRALLAVGLGESRARRLAPVALALAFCALVAALAGLWLHFHDRGVVERHEAALDARAAPARDAAADQRAADAIANARQEEKYRAAIDQAVSEHGDGSPGAAAVALNCERLRRAGVALPAACGPAGGDRGQAGPDR